VEGALAPRAEAQARGVEILAERVEDLPEQCLGRYDAVTLFDVFEHLLDPAEGLRAAASCLRPGGLLLVSTADMDAWTWRMAGGRHWYLQTPQHLSFASRGYFERFARGVGLVLRDYRAIAHGDASVSRRLRDSLEFAHWEFRHRGGVYRIPQRLLQALPGFRGLMHRTSAPWAMTLRDHALAVLQRPAREALH
jgi:SAM-dependent methyltransferase